MFDSWQYFAVMGFLLVVICFIVPPLLAARKGYSWYLWTIACGLLGLIVLAFLPFANKLDEKPEVNQARRQTGNIIGGVLSVIGLLAMFFQLLKLLFMTGTTNTR